MSFLLILMIAVSLSMDAFSLSLAYGTLSLDKKDIFKLSFIVGIYHFVMPLLGMFIGSSIIEIIPLKPSFVVFVILTIIGIQMIFETFKEEKKVEKMTLLQLLIFGLAVSIDSFSVGIGLNTINSNFLLCSIMFSISSFFFTQLGLIFGKKISCFIGKISTLIGGIVLIIIGVFSLFWNC